MILLLNKMNRGKVIFLGYHGVSPDATPYYAWTLVRETDFRNQMQYINNVFDCISIDEALQPDPVSRSRPAVVVTFDDGYANNLEVALPILETFSIPATIYITTGPVAERTLFWPDTIWLAARQSALTSIDLSDIAFPLSSYDFETGANGFLGGVLCLLEDIKKIPPKCRQNIVESIVERFITSSTTHVKFSTDEGHPFSPLTETQVATIANHPLITIGAHTHCHNLLNQISIQQAKASIEKSRSILEKMTGAPIRHFAYPNGNFDGGVVRIVREAGFHSAITFTPGFYQPGTDRFRIKRFGIGADMGFETFKTQLTGAFEFTKWRM